MNFVNVQINEANDNGADMMRGGSVDVDQSIWLAHCALIDTLEALKATKSLRPDQVAEVVRLVAQAEIISQIASERH